MSLSVGCSSLNLTYKEVLQWICVLETMCDVVGDQAVKKRKCFSICSPANLHLSAPLWLV